MDNELSGQIRAPATNLEMTTDTSVCPHCGRKLLSTRSILCNWCGQRINDPEYQERAAQERVANDAVVREQLEREVRETARRGVLGRLKTKAKQGDAPRPVLGADMDVPRGAAE